jgi:type IV pilus assembly protein PilP
MMIPRSLRLPAVVGFMFLTCAACEDRKSPEIQTVLPKKVKVAPLSPATKDVPAGEVVSAGDGYVYDPGGLRDPFEALVMIRKPVGGKGEPLTPLQKFDLAQFRLSAVIVGEKMPMATVVAPGGKAYVLKTGVKIGKNGGVVTRISPKTVTVVEKYYDFTGKLSTTSYEIGFTQKAGDI